MPYEDLLDIKALQASLLKYRETLKFSYEPEQVDPPYLNEKFELDGFLKEESLINPQYLQYLTDLPEDVQEYISKEFLKYLAYSGSGENDTDGKLAKLAEATNDFFIVQRELSEKALSEKKEIGQEWQDAVEKMSKALRHYYGKREGDDSWPCWNFL